MSLEEQDFTKIHYWNYVTFKINFYAIFFKGKFHQSMYDFSEIAN